MKVHITFEFLWHIGSFDLKNMCIIVWKLKLKNCIFLYCRKNSKTCICGQLRETPSRCSQTTVKVRNSRTVLRGKSQEVCTPHGPYCNWEEGERGERFINHSIHRFFFCQSMNKINLFNLIKLRSPVKCDYKEKINYWYLFFLLSLIKH